MTRKHEIRLRGRIIALAYVSPHPYLRGQMVVSVFPITRTGRSEERVPEVHFGPISHEGFALDVAPPDMIRQLIGSHIDGVATEGFSIEEVDLLGEADM